MADAVAAPATAPAGPPPRMPRTPVAKPARSAESRAAALTVLKDAKVSRDAKATASTVDPTEEALASAAAAPAADAKVAPTAGEGTPAPAAAAPSADPYAKARAEAAARFRAVEDRRRASQASAEQTRRQQAEWDAKQAEIKAAREELEVKTRNTQELVKKDPFAYLKSLGITAQELVDRGVKQGSPEAAREAKEAAVEAELGSIKKWKEDFLKEQAEKEQKQLVANHEALVKAERKKMEGLLDAHWKELPNIADADLASLFDRVMEVGRAFFKETGEEPDAYSLLKYVDDEEGKRKAGLRTRRQGAAVSDHAPATAGNASKQPAATPTVPSGPTSTPSRGSSRDDKRKAATAILSRAKG